MHLLDSNAWNEHTGAMQTNRSPARAARTLGLAAAGLIASEIAYAALRPAPPMEEFDPSGEFGSPDAPHVHVGVMGDSSCTGPGLDDADQIWVRQAARMLADDGFGLTVSSVAVGGARVAHLLRDQLEPMLALRPDIVLVSVGGNDALRGIRTPSFRRDLSELTRRLVDAGPVVVLSGVGDLGSIPRLLPPLSGLMRRRARRFDEVHAEVARSHGASKADQWAVSPSVFADPAIFAADHFHPGPLGHREWAEVAVSAIRPHLTRLTGG